MTTELDARILIRIPIATLVTSQTWIDTIFDYVSNEIEGWTHARTHARTNGDIEALADAMRALKNKKQFNCGFGDPIVHFSYNFWYRYSKLDSSQDS